MEYTPVFDSYWRFAAERHEMYMRRLENPNGPWTTDSILMSYRFTNVYRVLDRVSQYLIKEIIYRRDRPQSADELLYRIILFKIFNKIETWEYIEKKLGPISISSPPIQDIDSLLTKMMLKGERIYSAAYIMPSPNLGFERKHSNHLKLIQTMIRNRIPQKIEQSRSLRELYDTLLNIPSLGKFLAFQYAIDINYSPMVDFSESEMVVAGPGAQDGISKCFPHESNKKYEDIIFEMVDRQEIEFKRLGLEFSGLFGRRLQPIDCQNIFCEISKYARVAHPEYLGISGRTRIKQNYKKSTSPQPSPALPPKWGVSIPDKFKNSPTYSFQNMQGDLFK